MFNQFSKTGNPRSMRTLSMLHQSRRSGKLPWHLWAYPILVLQQDKGYGVEYHVTFPPAELCEILGRESGWQRDTMAQLLNFIPGACHIYSKLLKLYKDLVQLTSPFLSEYYLFLALIIPQ